MIDKEQTMLIITGCIAPCDNVFQLALSNQSERYKQYINCLKWAIVNSDFKYIVFADNSGSPVNEELIELAKKHDKVFEWLSFLGNFEAVKKFGKGFGEGEIIDYALSHANYINNIHYICKLTGRLIVNNLNVFLKKADINKAAFWTLYPNKIKKHSMTIDTRFYGMPLMEYNQNFRSAYKDVDDKNGIWLEKVFYQRFHTSKINVQKMLFYPDIIGQSGSTGAIYKNSNAKLICKSLASKIGVFMPKRKNSLLKN